MKRVLINLAFSSVCAIVAFTVLDKALGNREFAKLGGASTLAIEMAFCTAVDLRERRQGNEHNHL
jgi:hypothetical protein